MARKKKKRVYVNANGEALSHLSETPRPNPEPTSENPKAPKRRNQDQAKVERARQERERELEAINHEIEVEKRRTMAATWKTKTQNAELGIFDDGEGNVQSKSEHIDRVSLKMRELDAIAKFGQDKVSRVRNEAAKIFKNVHMLRGEQRARIQEIIEAYGVDATALPPAIEELMLIEEETYVEGQ